MSALTQTVALQSGHKHSSFVVGMKALAGIHKYTITQHNISMAAGAFGNAICILDVVAQTAELDIP